MDRRTQRKKHNIKEIDRCYLCNNKAQTKCKTCKQKICNDCLIEKKFICYKCQASKEIIPLTNKDKILSNAYEHSFVKQ